MRHSEQRISRNECSGQTQDTARQSDSAHACAQRFQAEDADHTLGQRTAICGHREGWSAAPLFHQSQGTRIFDGVPAESDGRVIAAVLALGANSFVEPPDRWMVEEQRLHANLENIHKGIEAPDVRQFVGNHQCQLFVAEAAERGHGQEHDGAKPSNHGRRLQPLAFAIRNGAIEPKLALQSVTKLKHARRNNYRLLAAFALPAAGIPRRSGG